MGMRIIKSMLRMRAAYWAPAGKDRYGEDIYTAPVEIKCRWEDSKTKDIGSKKGGALEETLFKATVYVDRDVELGGKLWLGETKHPLDELEKLKDENGKIKPPDDASEIRSFDKEPTLNAKQSVRWVKL